MLCDSRPREGDGRDAAENGMKPDQGQAVPFYKNP